MIRRYILRLNNSKKGVSVWDNYSSMIEFIENGEVTRFFRNMHLMSLRCVKSILIRLNWQNWLRLKSKIRYRFNEYGKQTVEINVLQRLQDLDE